MAVSANNKMVSQKAAALALGLTASLGGSAAAGEKFSFADSLSFLEEPLAVHIGDTTFQLRGSLEQAVQMSSEDADLQATTRGRFTFSGETKLRNQLTMGASFSVNATNRPGSIADVGGYRGQRYSREVQAYGQGVWGRVSAGNVRGEVGKALIRSSPAGNAALAFRGGFGRLDEWGGAYTGRFGPAVVALAVDQEGYVDAGLRWSRPIGNKDIGFAVRGTLGTFVPEDGSGRFDTHGATAIADVIYGSSMIELALGYEVLTRGPLSADRAYASAGLHHKVDAVTLSLMGHYGLASDGEEKSLAVGARYDIARGLSANAGVNYAKGNAHAGPVQLVDKDAVEGTVSLRYEF